jgi:uncharacterized protein with FMN-binding domain
MRKGIVTILAVAIIGMLGIYNNSQKAKSDTSVQGVNTVAAPISDNSSASQPVMNPAAETSSGTYKDGTYTGPVEENAYGSVQVSAVISGGKIVDIKFLQMPGPEGHSKEVTAFAESPLKQSTLAKQNAHIDFVSGATQTSESYEQSLQAALDQAI